MKKNYDLVPQWWFYSLLILIIGLTLLTCEGFGIQLQLPYWGVLIGISLTLLFTLPIYMKLSFNYTISVSAYC
ncbi:putative oligopeptide transporter, OPT superfamily [Helianthus anomalus]